MIIFDRVTKVYGTGQPALNDVSFQIDKGEFIVLKGHSGAGKTTISKLLMKEIVPTSGSITFQGQDLSQIKSSKLHLHRRQIGIVYQDYKLLPDLNVFENIALALRIAGKDKSEIESRIADLLQLIQLSDKAELFPSQLSGGEAQRISIARALANAPEILFADEPTGNLDEETSKHIIQMLRKINELGTTIIMSTHENIEFKDHPHREFILNKGSLQGSEKPSTPKKEEEIPNQEETSPVESKDEKKDTEKKAEKKTLKSKKES